MYDEFSRDFLSFSTVLSDFWYPTFHERISYRFLCVGELFEIEKEKWTKINSFLSPHNLQYYLKFLLHSHFSFLLMRFLCFKKIENDKKWEKMELVSPLFYCSSGSNRKLYWFLLQARIIFEHIYRCLLL